MATLSEFVDLGSCELRALYESEGFGRLIRRTPRHEVEEFIRYCQVKISTPPTQTSPPVTPPQVASTNPSNDRQACVGEACMARADDKARPHTENKRSRKRKRESQPVDDKIKTFIAERTDIKPTSKPKISSLLHEITDQITSFDYGDLWTNESALYEADHMSLLFKTASALRIGRILKVDARIGQVRKRKLRERSINALFLVHEHDLYAKPPPPSSNNGRNWDSAWLDQTSKENNIGREKLKAILARGRRFQWILEEFGLVELLELSGTDSRNEIVLSQQRIRSCGSFYKHNFPDLCKFRQSLVVKAGRALLRGWDGIGFGCWDLSASLTPVTQALFQYIDKEQLAVGYIVAAPTLLLSAQTVSAPGLPLPGPSTDETSLSPVAQRQNSSTTPDSLLPTIPNAVAPPVSFYQAGTPIGATPMQETDRLASFAAIATGQDFRDFGSENILANSAAGQLQPSFQHLPNEAVTEHINDQEQMEQAFSPLQSTQHIGHDSATRTFPIHNQITTGLSLSATQGTSENQLPPLEVNASDPTNIQETETSENYGQTVPFDLSTLTFVDLHQLLAIDLNELMSREVSVDPFLQTP